MYTMDRVTNVQIHCAVNKNYMQKREEFRFILSQGGVGAGEQTINMSVVVFTLTFQSKLFAQRA